MIQFAKSQGDYDFVSPIINFTGNSFVVAAAGISAGVVTAVALKALGFGAMTTALGAAIPFIAAGIGISGALLGSLTLIAITHAFIKALSSH